MSAVIRRINETADKQSSHKLLVTPRLSKWLASNSDLVIPPEMAEMVTNELQKVPRDRSASFSASARGSCMRKQVFGYIGVPGTARVDEDLAMLFIDGSIKHLAFQVMCLLAGAITDIEVGVDVPEKRMKGSIDGTNEIEKWGLELKTTQAFQYFLSRGPSPSHKLQVHSYLKSRPDLDRFSIVYWDTRTRQWKEFVIERDPVYMRLVNREVRILNESVDNRRLPHVRQECKSGRSKVFKDCPYSAVCRTINYDEAERLAQESRQAVTIHPNGEARRRSPQRRRPVVRTSRVRRRVDGQGT
jgi:hypothetical protein